VTLDGNVGLQRVKAAKGIDGPNDDLRLFRFGEHANLVGRDVAKLTVGAPSPVPVTLKAPGVTREFHATDGQVPCFVHGSTGSQPAAVAIALNGTILAVAPSEAAGEFEFWAALPETRFQEGQNTVELYTVDGTPNRPVLHPVTVQG
jgi:hypothetical protein